jgi:hypothetical protein
VRRKTSTPISSSVACQALYPHKEVPPRPTNGPHIVLQHPGFKRVISCYNDQDSSESFFCANGHTIREKSCVQNIIITKSWCERGPGHNRGASVRPGHAEDI